MKRVIPTILLLLLVAFQSKAQITSPVIRANFGVDADLRANYYNGALSAGNDDWFNFPGTPGLGQFVIDTTGAAGIVARYGVDMAFRRSTWARTMRYPAYSVVNNRTLLDAILVRDFHGDDSTVFASGGNKNGDNPLTWSTPVSQGIPDKNDILDMLVHVRRAGPNGTDSLWMMAGLSLDNTTGNRYFDFEMYQTDLYYDRPGLKFGGQGPDAGHTSWGFDAAGNIIKAGDIIFSAEYQSSSLTLVEARIWIDRANLAITPAAFSWGGLFDGANTGSQYGYASIVPKAAGAYYTGLQCSNNTWGGPFGIILQDDSYVTDYAAKQFVEFSVNLTKLGLDPLTRLGGDPCGMPFRRILVKTRASASFTAELKDFIAPFAFFDPPMADIATATPYICSQGSVAEIHVTNPLSTSIYNWTTPNGNIISATSGQSIIVDTPGTYIVTQYLLTACGAYTVDTVQILPFVPCTPLSSDFINLRGVNRNNSVQLTWKMQNNPSAKYFEVQRSIDGVNFVTIGTVANQNPMADQVTYSYEDDVSSTASKSIYYRIKIIAKDNSGKLSNTLHISLGAPKEKVIISPNPVKDVLQVQLSASAAGKVRVDIFESSGKLILSRTEVVQRGTNVLTIDGLANQPRGVYLATVLIDNELHRQKILLTK